LRAVQGAPRAALVPTGEQDVSKTGYAWHPGFQGHFTRVGHPEHPDRARALDVQRMMIDLPGLQQVKVDEGLGFAWVRRVHEDAYVSAVRDAHGRGTRVLDRGDTWISGDSYEVGLLAISATLTLVAQVAAGTLDNGFAAVRPPGHHAGVANARGFCLFNNVAVAARFAQQCYGYSRILILDWDVHPADGTEAIFYDDPNVHVVSVHQHGIFTETVGTEAQSGRGEGEGTTYNVPVAKGSNEAQILQRLEPVLERAASRCRPDLVLVSCGFDAHRADPVGGLGLDDESFRVLTTMAKRVARQHAGGRLVSVLEGGYSPEVLSRCARVHVETLMD
jgi:acetoin utilization deacetylase AcuC-like enzyme